MFSLIAGSNYTVILNNSLKTGFFGQHLSLCHASVSLCVKGADVSSSSHRERSCKSLQIWSGCILPSQWDLMLRPQLHLSSVQFSWSLLLSNRTFDWLAAGIGIPGLAPVCGWRFGFKLVITWPTRRFYHGDGFFFSLRLLLLFFSLHRTVHHDKKKNKTVRGKSDRYLAWIMLRQWRSPGQQDSNSHTLIWGRKQSGPRASRTIHFDWNQQWLSLKVWAKGRLYG